jgi:hypothetical protein
MDRSAVSISRRANGALDEYRWHDTDEIRLDVAAPTAASLDHLVGAGEQ